MLTDQAKPFRIDLRSRGSGRMSLLRAAAPMLERALAFPALNEIYEAIKDEPDDGRDFTDKALEALHIDAHVLEKDLKRIPRTGPVVVVANHPFGGVEGLILHKVLRRVRPDVKLLANHLLAVIEDLHDSFYFVDPFGGEAATLRNRASMRSAVRWLSGGGALGVFPAGAVSHLQLRTRTVTDPPWSDTVARLIRRTGAHAVPVFFHGRNSTLFQASGLVHPRVRTTLLPRELLRMRHHTIRLEIGNSITPPRMQHYADPAALTGYLRVRTYLLQSRDESPPHDRQTDADLNHNEAAPVIDPVPIDAMLDEVARLPDSQRLVACGDKEVLIAGAAQIPAVLREIGRLREVAFRLVGEGTGRSIDLDRFDQHYLHLFVWNRERACVIGSYRMGLTDRVLAGHGIEGLYTSTLFSYKRRLLEQIGPAIELGRSFVHPGEQRGFAPLMLLWCGIGRFVAANPRYRHLFGTVSISARYRSMSRQILMSFLQTHRSLPRLAGLLKPRNPPRRPFTTGPDRAAFSTTVEDIGSIDELLADIEADGKPMPVLLRQYLKLNGRLLGLNIDPEFGNVLDGLMLFDVLDIPRPLLNRYMGKAQASGFLAYHNRRA